MRSVVSASVMMMPFGDTVNVTLRNFLALALACTFNKKHTHKHKSTSGGMKKEIQRFCHSHLSKI